MPGYKPEVPEPVTEVIRHLPPGIKRLVRSAIRAIADDPAIGDPLRGELDGRFKYRVRRFRIVYRLDRARRVVHIVAVGHRRDIYEELARRGSAPE